MKFLIGLVVGAIIAAAIGAGAMGVAFGDAEDVDLKDRDKSEDISKTFDLEGFDQIEIAGVYELDVSVGPDFSIEIDGPEHEMARIDVSVKDNVLVLDTRERERGEKRHWANNGVTAKISMPALSGLEISGVVDGDIEGVDAQAFSMNLAGVGDVDIEGACETLEAHVAGVGDFDAKDLHCKSVKVRVSGVGSASVFASEAVDANVSGMGSIGVYGSPSEVEKSGTMFSNIKIH